MNWSPVLEGFIDRHEHLPLFLVFEISQPSPSAKAMRVPPYEKMTQLLPHRTTFSDFLFSFLSLLQVGSMLLFFLWGRFSCWATHLSSTLWRFWNERLQYGNALSFVMSFIEGDVGCMCLEIWTICNGEFIKLDALRYLFNLQNFFFIT